jgi:hypothetical protein
MKSIFKVHDMRHTSSILIAGIALLSLSACGDKKAELDQLDSQLAGKDSSDPALTAALEDQIMVDPTLSGQANSHAIRPPAEPMQTPVPQNMPAVPAKANAPVKTLGGLANEQAEVSRDSFNGCGLNVQYSMDYAAQLPDDMPFYPKAQVVEAAGSNDNGCKLRAVTFNAAAPVRDVARHYAGMATQAGYKVASKAEAGGVMISGRRVADGGAFYVILNGMNGGTTADLVLNNGK